MREPAGEGENTLRGTKGELFPLIEKGALVPRMNALPA